MLEGLESEGWAGDDELGLRIAECWNNRGNCQRLIDPERAVSSYEEALERFAALSDSQGMAPARLWLVKGRSNLALVLSHLGREADASRAHALAVALGRSFVSDVAGAGETPGEAGRDELLTYDLDFRYALAVALTNQGEHLAGLGRPEEAEPIFREALDLYIRLADAVPHYLEYPWSVAMARTNLGWAIGTDPDRPDEATTLLREAATWYRPALARAPGNAELAVYAGVNQLRLGKIEAGSAEREGRPAGPQAIEAFEEAIASFRLAGGGPEPVMLRAEAQLGLGDAYRSAGENDRASAAWGRALALLGPLDRPDLPLPMVIALLARIEARLASDVSRRGDEAESAVLLDQARRRLAAARDSGLGVPVIEEAEAEVERLAPPPNEP